MPFLPLGAPFLGPFAQWAIWLKICSDLKKISSFILVARIDPWNTLIPNLTLVYLFEARKPQKKASKVRGSDLEIQEKKFTTVKQ